MSKSMNGNSDGTPRSSHLSPTSATPSQSWLSPKSPLSPHRLAKLANALGVSTPVPASHSPTTFLSRSFSESSGSGDHFRRSPTPSSASSMVYNHQTSRFLLHVIPPLHLPHDSDDAQSAPPPNTPGYHTQFRRGTLVPVHSTLQAQLGAIAREYALPSTAGLILYLVSSTPQSEGFDEPGPRLSEDIWRHLWTRVLRTERDDMMLPSRSPTPLTPRTPHLLGYGPAAQSTPFLPTEGASSSLRPLLASPAGPESFISPHAPQPMYPSTTAPSTPSSISDRRSNNKSAPPSTVSQSEPGTPDTSVEDAGGLRVDTLDLPGLNSPSLIPILAKVEFDIDRRKAGWYDPWLRSRKVNHAKRAESRNGMRKDSDGERTAPIELLTGRKKKKDPFGFALDDGEEETKTPVDETPADETPADEAPTDGAPTDETPTYEVPTDTTPEDEDPADDIPDDGVLVDELPADEGYARLSESPEELEAEADESDGSDYEEGEDELLEDATARISSLTGVKDPLDDVFGTDADTWADIHAERGADGEPMHRNPNIVELSLTAEDLSTDLEVSSDDHHDGMSTKEEDDVREMLDIMGRPELAMAIPSPAKDKRSSSPTSVSGRKVPPPLVLKPKHKSGSIVLPAIPTPAELMSPDTALAYLDDATPEKEFEHADGDGDEFEQYMRVRSPTESDKRGGAVFDDLDLGLDPTEDFDDPNDRRRSQLIMRAQLDEIERTLAQLSPRMLKVDLEEEQSMSLNSLTLSPSSRRSQSLSPRSIASDHLPPPSPRLPQHADPPESPTTPIFGQSWPAVPFSSIKDKGSMSEDPNAAPSPPRLAVNGVTTSAPKSYSPSRTQSTGPSETEKRKKEQDESGLYPPASPSQQDSPSESPVIPLSPDPFGRYPSSPEPPQAIRTSGAQWDTLTTGHGIMEPESMAIHMQGRARSGTSASRFSADSLNGMEEAPTPAPPPSKPTSTRSTLMSVKTIKKLWRTSKPKSNSSSNSNTRPPTPTAPPSGRTSPMVPAVPPTPTTSSSGRISPMVPQRPERPSEESLELPDMPDIPPPTNFGRLSPQPVPQQSQFRSSIDQVNNQGRRSVDQQMPPAPQRPSMDQLGPPAQQGQFQQLSIPSFPGRNPNAGPIMTPHMQASRSASSLDRLHFDQESPYPIRRSPRPPSPPALPAIPEQEKSVARKSILKWKSSSSNNNSNGKSHKATPSTSESQPRSSFERPNSNGNSRGRRPSVINFGSTRASVTSPDLPASPPIPSQYMSGGSKVNGVGYVNGGGLEHQSSQRSRPSLDSNHSRNDRDTSPRPSMASSRDSLGSRPSFDASQFEFVSPKVGTLSYPYNAFDQ